MIALEIIALGFFLWLAFSLAAGAIAASKGRSAFGFFLLSILLTPLIGITAALIVSGDPATLERQGLNSGALRKCHACAEPVRREAVKCKHCGVDLAPIVEPPPGLLAKIFLGK